MVRALYARGKDGRRAAAPLSFARSRRPARRLEPLGRPLMTWICTERRLPRLDRLLILPLHPVDRAPRVLQLREIVVGRSLPGRDLQRLLDLSLGLRVSVRVVVDRGEPLMGHDVLDRGGRLVEALRVGPALLAHSRLRQVVADPEVAAPRDGIAPEPLRAGPDAVVLERPIGKERER